MKALCVLRMLPFMILLIPLEAFGQATLRGSVRDSVTGEPLVGANVYIQGTSQGGVTDREGQYRIPGVSEGTVVLKVSYIGYTAKEFEINVPTRDVEPLVVLLTPDVLVGEEILITAQARGQIAAINQQLSSNTIVSVISEEKIKELPDANAAEAIGRLPGVSITRSGGEANRAILRGMSDRFGIVTIDGIRMASTDVDTRGLDLSTVSQGSLAGIELFKALTPDKDGDAIAGAINLVTRKAPSERLLRLESKGAYSKLNQTGKQYDFALRYGERFFDDLLGVQLSGNLEKRDRSSETTDINYNVNKGGAVRDYEITDFILNFVDEVRKRGGFGALVDVNTPDGGTVKVSNVFNSTNRNYITYARDYPDSAPSPMYGARDREQEIATFNSSVRGDNNFLGMGVVWGLAFAQSRAEDPYDYEMDFIEPQQLDPVTHQVIAGMNYPDSLTRKGPPEIYIPYAVNNFSKAYLNTAYFRHEMNLEKEKTALLDFIKDYVLADNFSGSLKFGGKYRHKTRFKEKSELLASYYLTPFPVYTRLPDGTVVRKDFSGTRFSGFQSDQGRVLVSSFLGPSVGTRDIFGRYLLNPMINRDYLRDWYALNQNGVTDSSGRTLEYNRNNAVDADYYDIVERVGAAYVMNTFNFGQEVSLIAGVRVEAENNDYASRFSPADLSGFPTPAGLIKDTTVSYAETIWLPNIQITTRPFDFMTVRLAAYRALARPDFNLRLENFIARKQGTFFPGNSVSIGNPRLRAAKAWNYEVNTSFHSNTIGLFTISAFYKNIKEMFHVANGVEIEGDPQHNQRILDSLGILWKAPQYGVPRPDFYLSYAYNSPRATEVWGFEFEHQTNLRFLPGLLQNIVLNYNLSIVRSETYIVRSQAFTDTVLLPPPFPPSLRSRHELQDVKTKLEGQPDLFGNVAVGYDIDGFSARVSVYFQGQFNRAFSGDGKTDQVTNKFSKWDFIARQDITGNIAVMLSVNNFTNVQEDNTLIDREKGWELLDTSQLYGLTADLGVRITL